MTTVKSAKKIQDLIQEVTGHTVAGIDESWVARGIARSSVEVEEDFVFFAEATAHQYIQEALIKGAKVVVTDEPFSGARESHVVLVPDVRLALSRAAHWFYDAPSHELEVLGFTGTNGKTTTTCISRQLLESIGRSCLQIGTLGAFLEGAFNETGTFTTPWPHDLHRMLRRGLDAGAESVVIELSSHALELGRAAHLRLATGAFLNLTPDHLDFHQSMNSYYLAKRRMVDLVKKFSGVFLANIDDPYADEALWYAASQSVASFAFTARVLPPDLRTRLQQSGIPLLEAQVLRSSFEGQQVMFHFEGESVEVFIPLLGGFNVRNALAAVSSLLSRGYPFSTVVHALQGVSAPAGRLESIPLSSGALAVVDYAHTPDALEKALDVLRSHCRGKLIVVFGCGGNRDRVKRSLMMVVARGHADVVIITQDNPRTEDPEQIISDIVQGGEPDMIIHDRSSAIHEALEIAREGDLVLIAGKGHEQYQVVGTEVHQFSDVAEVQMWAQRHESVPCQFV